MTGAGSAALRIAARLEFASLDELERGFAERLSEGALFLARASLGEAPDDLYVGAPVRVELTTSQGERALTLDGVIAWSYPAHPRTPPGREAGAGITIDRALDDDSRDRLARMLRQPGAGARVRAPGTRLAAFRLARPPMTPRVPSALVARPTSAPSVATTPTSAPAPRVTSPATGPVAPQAAGGASVAHDMLSSLLSPSPSQPSPPSQASQPTGEVRELVVPMPPAPQPRVMAMGMFVDQSVDPTPTPTPLPLPPVIEDSLPAEDPEKTSVGPPMLPFAGLLADLLAPSDEELSAPHSAETAPTVPPTLDSLPDAPPVATPPGAFEQRQTDVDLLVSLEDADFMPAEQEERVARASPLTSRDAGSIPSGPVAGEDAAPNPALAEETVSSWNQLDDLPSADGDAELISDDDAVALEGPDPPASPIFAAPILSAPTLSAPMPAAPMLAAPMLAIPNVESAELRSAERTAIMPAPVVEGWDGNTEHGLAPITDQPTSESSRPSAEPSEPTSESTTPGVFRPLPELPGFPSLEPSDEGPMGVAYVYSLRRGGPDPVHALESFAWPPRGTKRWSAIDVAREEGEAALDAAVTSSPWLARDPSGPGGFTRAEHTDPGINVSDVVTKAVALAAEEEDSVFSDVPPPVRPAMRKPGEDGAESQHVDALNETTVDETFHRPQAAPPPDPEEEVATDRDMKRPPSQAARLGLLNNGKR